MTPGLPEFQPRFDPLAPNPLDHYAEPPAGRRRGPEIDEDGVGGTKGDWRFRVMPRLPGFNEQ